MKRATATVALLAAVGSAHAQSSWEAGPMSNNEGVFAAVANDSGVIFGRYCYYKDQTCVWIMANEMGCKLGDEYPALATAETSTHLTLVCGGKSPTQSHNRYYLKPYDTVEGLVNQGGTLGVAMVAESGNFKVYRFDLRGAKAMLDQADVIYRNRSRTKDQTL